jgi:hypothetical protein
MFLVIWYSFPRFGLLYQEKSGNPGIVYVILPTRKFQKAELSKDKIIENGHFNTTNCGTTNCHYRTAITFRRFKKGFLKIVLSTV